MGADIEGWVEVREPHHGQQGALRWRGVITVSGVTDRNYHMFALLFDIRNSANIPTPFARRGIPDDRSYETWMSLRAGIEDETVEQTLASAVKPTWLTWREIQSLPWNDEAQDTDARISVDWSKLGADPDYEYTDWEDYPIYKGFETIQRRRVREPQALWETFYRAKPPLFPRGGATAYIYPDAPGGTTFMSTGAADDVFQLRRPFWRDWRYNGWDMLFKLMATLADEYGEDGVRLVGWFNQE